MDCDDIAWQPTAPLPWLRERARLLAELRAFFTERGIMEVETPLLSATGTLDPHIGNMVTHYRGPEAHRGRELYLQTSPEFAMKRLLAAGSGPIYQVCKAFRDGERGQWHNPEFTLVEWYRPGFDHYRLMDEVDALVGALLGTLPAERLSYRQAFQRYVGIDPEYATLCALRDCACRHDIEDVVGLAGEDRGGWLDLLLTHVVQPKLGRDRPTFLYAYPAFQAALAQLEPVGAARFELYYEGAELANGYYELGDPEELLQRFQEDLKQRRRDSLPEVPMDKRLLAALEQGLPDCAGVALGFDRLVMLATGAQRIDEVISFSIERA